MWTEDKPSFEGRYYQIRDAHCSPKPLQKPHPPIMIGGGGEKLMLRVVAQYADVCNFSAWFGRPENYLSKLNVLERHCEKVSRDPSEIQKSWASYVIIKEDKEEVEGSLNRFVERATSYYGPSAYKLRPPILGTPKECVEQIKKYIEIGVGLFILMFVGGDNKGEANLFAEEVAPALR